MARANGRPSKLTPEVQARICQAIAAGNYLEAACVYGGIDYSNFTRWMARGEKEVSGKFCDFRSAVLKAQADAEIALVTSWRQHVPADWRAARDLLARRFPDRWGPKEKHEVTGGVTMEIVEEIVDSPGHHHADNQAPRETTGVPPQ